MLLGNQIIGGQENMLGAALQAKQQQPVVMAIEQLEKELHYLHESVAQLEQRLNPVIRPTPASTGNTKDVGCGGSPLVHHIEMLNTLARQTSAQVVCLLECLEI
jgi:hypothetical protein